MENKKIITKLDLLWYTLALYLDDLHGYIVLIDDEELNRYYTEFTEYVDKMLAFPAGEIDEIYVTVKHNVSPENG